MTAYYNEVDPYAAAWLRNLIAAGHIAPGDVDERSIDDVSPDDLRGYRQCHFFAGIGVWSFALRNAGWDDDREVWTGSCPCQPFSAAGKGEGFADERHLWPAWHWLIAQCKPAVVFGEQVSSKAVEPWIDLVSADLEGLGYAFGAMAFPAAGVGAPHIRDRAYFVADAERRTAKRQRLDVATAASRVRSTAREQRVWNDVGHGGAIGVLADADSRKRDGLAVVRRAERDGSDARRSQGRGQLESRGDVRNLGDADNKGLALGSRSADGERVIRFEGSALGEAEPVRGFWRGADWIYCRDGKYRPVEPGTFPLADGAPSRLGRLRAYGNAVNAEAARCFIEAAQAALGDYDLL